MSRVKIVIKHIAFPVIIIFAFFCALDVNIKTFNKHRKLIKDIDKQAEEIFLIHNVEINVIKLLMSPKDFLLIADKNEEAKNFKALSYRTQETIKLLSKNHFDYIEQEYYYVLIKRGYAELNDLSMQAFSSENGMENSDIKLLVKQMNDVAENIVLNCDKMKSMMRDELGWLKNKISKTERFIFISGIFTASIMTLFLLVFVIPVFRQGCNLLFGAIHTKASNKSNENDKFAPSSDTVESDSREVENRELAESISKQ